MRPRHVDERRESVFVSKGCAGWFHTHHAGIFTAAVIGDTPVYRRDVDVRSTAPAARAAAVESRVQHQVGSDLHDGVGQQLAASRMMLKSLERRLGRRDSGDLRSDRPADRGSRERSPAEHAFAGARPCTVHSDREVCRGARNCAERDGSLPVKGGWTESSRRMRIGADTASNLYRIAQEGVLNAARHSKANQISVRLGVTAGMAELLVKDDGHGFDPQKVTSGGMGLRVMRFRAQMLGGYFSVESEPGGGTTLHCRCPLLPAQEAA